MATFETFVSVMNSITEFWFPSGNAYLPLYSVGYFVLQPFFRSGSSGPGTPGPGKKGKPEAPRRALPTRVANQVPAAKAGRGPAPASKRRGVVVPIDRRRDTQVPHKTLRALEDLRT
ncbi:hypothetical protein RF11_15916 [Thelohanellus kitauei]|uniref:Uncharacterized protein n=1 Tax=Thelohanellus kitauei TaxID=669202 RepID=A0A0C2MD67_THEKT|nr:hypothetical protein RF11_15916 [Thelohanellus kitauei]